MLYSGGNGSTSYFHDRAIISEVAILAQYIEEAVECKRQIGSFQPQLKAGDIYTDLGWSLENSWSKSSKSNSLSFFETDAVAKGSTYHLSVAAKVTSKNDNRNTTY